jgi:hypothetical protein
MHTSIPSAENAFGKVSLSSTRQGPVIPDTLSNGTDISSPPSAAPSRGSHPGRIIRTQHIRSRSLGPAQRSELVDRLYAIYNATLYGYTRDQFEEMVLGADEVRLVLYYGVGDELAGFAFCSIERIEHAGRRHAAIYAGVFFRPGYRGGVSGALFGLRQALRAKLSQPLTPLAYLTRCTTPAVYRLLASTMPRVYPSRRYRTPADIEALVRALNARRRYVAIGSDPWIVRSIGRPHDPSRLRRLGNDPDVRFYTELNPRFAEGESLLAWTPLDLANIAGGFVRTLRAQSIR